MIKNIFALLFIYFFSINCFSQINLNVGSWQMDKNIDDETKEKIHNLNYQIIEGFINSDPELVFEVCSKGMLKLSKNELIIIVNQIGQDFKKEKYLILNEFHHKISSKNTLTKVMSGLTGYHDYILHYEAANTENFISVGYFDNDITQTCLTFVYGKYGKEWKLNTFQFAFLREMRKDAIDWYLSAKSKYEKGYLIDAASDMFIASKILKPANEMIQYLKEDEILDFGNKVYNEVNKYYKFPLKIDTTVSKIEIFNVYPQKTTEGYNTMIEYTSSYSIEDTLSLSHECDSIHENIGKIFKGIDLNNIMIFYRAYEAIPNGKETVRRYGFIRRFKN